MAKDGRLEVVGTAETLDQALAAARRLTPEAVLLDLALPGARGAAATLSELYPASRLVALGLAEVESEVLHWAEVGISGYVFRDASLDEVVATVQSAIRRELRCSRRIAGALLRQVSLLSFELHNRQGAADLTPREKEVLALLDEGLTNKEISSRLFIEVATVKNHVHHILDKLDAHTRGEAAVKARRLRQRSVGLDL
jgi:DNA-binding NarL/FixJ family response regulator